MKNSILLFGLGVLCGLAVPFIIGSNEPRIQIRSIGRVIGSPGDVVGVHDGAVYVNGKKLEPTIQFRDYR